MVIAARAETQVERLVTLLRHRDLSVKARLGKFDPATLDDERPTARQTALVVVGSLARGVVAPEPVAPEAARYCKSCGYLTSAPGHKIACEDG